MTWARLKAALDTAGANDFFKVLRADSDLQKQEPVGVATGLLDFGSHAKVRLAAFTGVAAMTLGLGARKITSLYKTGVRKFKPQLDGNAALELQSEAGLGHAFLDLIDEVSFIGRPTLGNMDHRKREARAEWIHKVRLEADDPRRQWDNYGRVVSGDPSQLPPIGEPEVIDTSTPQVNMVKKAETPGHQSRMSSSCGDAIGRKTMPRMRMNASGYAMGHYPRPTGDHGSSPISRGVRPQTISPPSSSRGTRLVSQAPTRNVVKSMAVVR